MKKPVTIYGAAWCPYCHEAAAWLKEQKVDFDYIDIDQDPAARQTLDQELGQNNYYIPVIKIKDSTLQGFDPSEIQKHLDKLSGTC